MTKTVEQGVIGFNFHTEMKDGKEVIFFFLDTYPTVKFRYENVRFGSPDEDNLMPVMFDLDVAHLKEIDEVQLDEDFNDQVKGLLVHLLQKANNRAADIINEPEIKSLTTHDSPAIMHLTEQDGTEQEETEQEETKQDK